MINNLHTNKKSKQMKIVTGLGSIDDYPDYVAAGADECFIGYIPEEWMDAFGYAPLNRREVKYYNVQIGSFSEMLILGEMMKDLKVPVTIAMNALQFTDDQRKMVTNIIEKCAQIGFEDFILADPSMIASTVNLINRRDSGSTDAPCIHVSGEYGELNHLILEELIRLNNKRDRLQARSDSDRTTKNYPVKRIIFPRQTTLAEMKSMISKHPDFEYEAFLLNEKCHFTGAYCNSLHCDEFCHSCKIPYRLDGGSISSNQSFTNDIYEPEENSLASTGCSLCHLWKFREIGITHLKLVSRGNDTASTIRDIKAIRKALDILQISSTEEEYQTAMKKQLFPTGCPGSCMLTPGDSP